MTRAPAPGTRARFAAAMTAIVRRLPFGPAEIIPASPLGFAVINGFTFAVDLGLLTICTAGWAGRCR